MSQQENNNEQDLPSFQIEKIEKLKKEEERRRQWRKDMEENIAMQKYFEQYTDESVSSFIESYFVYKNLWIEYGDMYNKMMEDDSIQWVSKASEYLEYIQQKKLFDMQCLWRAEKVELETVQIVMDFKMWEHDILNCPFLEPITPDDIDLMNQFLNQPNADTELGWFDDWQDYEGIKEAYNTDNANRNFPDWYDFYNGRRGTGIYMILPDIKGEKESFYMDLWRETKKEEWAAQQQQAEANQAVRKQYLSSFDKNNMEWFVTTFENKEVQQFYKAYEWSNKSRDDEEMMEKDLRLLFSAEEYVPIENNMDWKEGVKIAAQKYRLKKIAEALPEAYEQYLMNVQMGIGFANENQMFDTYEGIKRDKIKCLLIGRKLNGEPEDLDY